VSVEVAPQDHFQQLLAVAILLVGGGAAAIALSRRAGLGTVLGLIALGVVLGPYAFGHLIEIAPVGAAAELGVVLLLFVIGLEIEPRRLWAMRRMLFGLGSLQVLATGVALTLVALAFGRPWSTALVAGFGLSMSSTAFVLQLLRERNEFGTAQGRAALAVLLLQDMMIVPLLALVPLLAPGAQGQPDAMALPWLLLETAGALALLAFLGTTAVPWALALLARHRDREAFAALAAVSVLLGAWISHSAGLSAALGAFLLGVLLSRSPLHHQIAAEILPFKGLLLGLFFILIGMSIDLAALRSGWPSILAQVVVLVAVKAAILLGLCRLFGMRGPTALRTSLLLVQGGEFGFVLFSAARAAGVIEAEFYTTLLLVISASMALTPIVVRLGDRLAVRLEAAEPVPEPSEVEPETAAVIVGYGRVGQTVMAALRCAGVEATAVDIDPTALAVGARLGHRVIYGDAADPRLLSRIGSADTRVVVVAVDRPDRAEAAVSAARAAYPNALVVARAHNDDRRPKLEQIGAGVVLTETLELSLSLAEAALLRLEVPAEAAIEALASSRLQAPGGERYRSLSHT
jgi:glutathione-regulated potassium-efflux system ancillary protein KefC